MDLVRKSAGCHRIYEKSKDSETVSNNLFRTSSVVLPKTKCREFAAINRTLKELSPKDIENGTWGIIPYEKKTFQ